ncbi:MAG: hypothetical protein II886_13610 [Prevotella sp.]|nr:hypothetical protein [Prevotella sp.]
MKIGERVVVDAAVTGDGVHHHGVIEDIYDFGRASFFDVHFDEPTPCGAWGATVNNPGLLRKEVES